LEDYVVPRTKELTPEQELMLEKNLVWIFASPRSGTTWLGTQLLEGKTYTMDEPRIGRLIIPTLMEIDDRRKDYFFSNDYKKTWNYFLRKLILNRIFAQFQDFDKIITIKEPNASLAAPIISDCLPESKIIIMLRDGRDVIDSLINARSDEGWITKSEDQPSLSKEGRLGFIKFEGKSWVTTIPNLRIFVI